MNHSIKLIVNRLIPITFQRKCKLLYNRYTQPCPAFYKKAVDMGTINNNSNRKLIISLTSYPARISTVHYTINTLLTQTMKPNLVILWLSDEQFPNKEKNLPANLLKLQKYGLTISWYKNILSYKKFVPTLQKYPEDIIITADDDLFYQPQWLEILYSSYQNSPNLIHCHRAHKITFDHNKVKSYEEWESGSSKDDSSYLNFLTSGGGVLFPPHSLYKDVCNEELFTKLCPTADDIWLWAMAVLNRTKIKIVKNNLDICVNNKANYYCALMNQNLGERKNDTQLNLVFNHYPQLQDILFSEFNK